MIGNTRREYLAALGAATVLPIAGCSNNGATDQGDGIGKDTESESASGADTATSTDADGQSPGQAESAGDWPMSRRDLANSAYVPADLNLSNGVEKGQVYEISMAGWPPLFVDDVVYYITGADPFPRVSAIDRTDGTKLWTIDDFEEEPGRVLRTPAVADDTIVFGTGGGLYAADTTDGTIKWRAGIGDSSPLVPTIKDGVVYTYVDERTCALDLGNGEKLWTYDNPPLLDRAMVAKEDSLYFPISDGDSPRFVSLDRHDGTERWSAGNVFPGPVAYYNGKVFCLQNNDFDDDGYSEGKVIALNAADGSKLWTGETVFKGFNSPAVGDGILCVSTTQTLTAFKTDTGEEMWKLDRREGDLDRNIRSQPVIVNETVMVTNAVGKLLAFDVETGEERWAYTADNCCSKLVVAGNSIYVANNLGDNRDLLALSPQSSDAS